MISIMEWILEKMRLVEVDEEIEESEPEQVEEHVKKTRRQPVRWKKDKLPMEDGRVYFKNVQTYADCKLVIDNYKLGAVCMYRLEPEKNPDAQGMMNYICGGICALDGDIANIGGNVFMTTRIEEK